jgi:transposase-like protein
LAVRSASCTFVGNGFGGEHVMIVFKGSHFERDVILWAVRWYVAYPGSYRQLEEESIQNRGGGGQAASHRT